MWVKLGLFSLAKLHLQDPSGDGFGSFPFLGRPRVEQRSEKRAVLLYCQILLIRARPLKLLKWNKNMEYLRDNSWFHEAEWGFLLGDLSFP